MSFVKCLLSFMNTIVKKRNIVLFNSYPAFSDNSYALYNYIINNRLDILEKYKIIWGQDAKDPIPNYFDKSKLNFVNKKSLRGIITFLKSKYVFSTHGYFPDVKSGNGQIQINLWHGCGYKTVNRGISKVEQQYLGDYTIATSSIYKVIQSENLNFDFDKVAVTGLPRNDALFSRSDSISKLGIDVSNKKVIIWMPTYRKAVGYRQVNGNANSFGLASLNKTALIRINRILEMNGLLLIIKLHPMEAIDVIKDIRFSNILILNSSDLDVIGINLYSLLGETDCLISDYSSVVIDYLLTDKPIVMVLSDMEEYKSSRGFVFDNVNDYFPGPVISCEVELINYFNNFESENSKWKLKRELLKKKLHNYDDNCSCKRVCDYFFGEAK